MLDLINIADANPTATFIALFIGTFISEDATCLIAGTAVAAGETTFAIAVSACFAGIFVGDVALYGAGRVFGPAIFQTRIVRRLVSDQNRHRAHAWLNRNTAVAVFTSRFVSGLRLPVYLASGAVKADAAKFTFWFLVAALVWTPLLVGAAAFSVRILAPGNLFFGFVATGLLVRTVITLSSWKKRRLFIGRLKRLYRWEFWSLPIFYAPVTLYVLWLGIRHGCLTLFTAANPAMPASGFVGESKDEIYSMINSSPSAAKHSLRHIKVNASREWTERLHCVVSFITGSTPSFPLVIKPDVGERGKGVQIVRDLKQLIDVIRTVDRDLILQEFCPGVEASVFYYRFPDEKTGHLFSITEKEFPFVTGDGISTVERLILHDGRAVCMTKSYFREVRGRLDHVPKKGERVILIDIGTHSRGAIFRDGERLRTPELESAIDEISRGVAGFYFGRYDLRADSFDDLKAGDFKIIELNGVSSESTNIYDHRYSLIDAYKILFRQWRLAFAIGAANGQRGFSPVTATQFARLAISRDISCLRRPDDGDKLLTVCRPKSCA